MLCGYSGETRLALKFKVKVKVKLLSHVQFFATPWNVAYEAPLSMGFSMQESWSGLPFPSPGIFPTQGWNPGLLHCRQTLYRLSHQEVLYNCLSYWPPIPGRGAICLAFCSVSISPSALLPSQRSLRCSYSNS